MPSLSILELDRQRGGGWRMTGSFLLCTKTEWHTFSWTQQGGHTDTRSGSLRGWFIHLQRAHSHAQQTAVYLADMLVLAKFMHSRQHHHVYKEQTCGSFKNNRKFKTLISPKQIWELIKRSTRSHFQSQFARIRLHQVIGLCEQTHRSRMHWKATTALCTKTEKKIQILGCLWCEYGITDLQCV